MLPKIFRKISYTRKLYFLLIPYTLGILLLVILPGILSFVLAFFRYDALSLPLWVGNLNFILAYTDELFLLSVQNSISLVLFETDLRNAVAERIPSQQEHQYCDTALSIVGLAELYLNTR